MFMGETDLAQSLFLESSQQKVALEMRQDLLQVSKTSAHLVILGLLGQNTLNMLFLSASVCLSLLVV